MTGRTVAQAARDLRVSPATIRRRIRQGTLRVVGGDDVGGRGRGYRVELPGEQDPCEPLLEFLRIDSGLCPGRAVPAHRFLGIPERTAAQYLLLLARHFERRGFSEAERTLRAIALNE